MPNDKPGGDRGVKIRQQRSDRSGDQLDGNAGVKPRSQQSAKPGAKSANNVAIRRRAARRPQDTTNLHPEGARVRDRVQYDSPSMARGTFRD
jgi:hypothetical protein